MKLFKVSIPLDYVYGKLRRAHGELYVEAQSKEQVRNVYMERSGMEYFMENADVVVDDFEIDEVGHYNFFYVDVTEVKDNE